MDSLCSAVALLSLTTTVANAAIPLAAPGAGTLPRASFHCGYESYHSEFPLGGVIVNDTDKPGPAGNEINNIFAVMRGDEVVGWMYTSFDGSVMFEPLAELGYSTFRIGVKMPKAGAFNVAPLLQTAFKIQPKLSNAKFAKTVTALRGKDHVLAKLVPCFARPWD